MGVPWGGEGSGTRAVLGRVWFKDLGLKRLSRKTWVVVKIRVPFGGTLNNGCRIILGTQKGTIILTTTHMVRGVIRARLQFFWNLGLRAQLVLGFERAAPTTSAQQATKANPSEEEKA